MTRLNALLSAITVAAAPLVAQSLDRCRELARERYPEIQRLGLIQQTEKFSLSNASRAWLPQGSLYAQATWQNNVMNFPEQFSQMLQYQNISFPGLKPLQYKVGADLSQQIWDGGHSAASRRQVYAESEVERRNVEVSLYDVDSRVTDVYFGLLLLDERISGARLTATLLDSTLSQVNALVANGVALRSDALQVEAQRLAVESRLDQLAASRSAYARVLELFTGEHADSLSPPAPQVSFLSVSPTDRLFDAQLNSISARERAVKSASMPVIGAFASAYYGYPGLNYFKSMTSGKMNFNLLAGIKIQWNFGALYTRSNDLRNLGLRRQSVVNARETSDFNRSVRSAQQQADIDAMQKVIENDDRIVRLRREVLDAARSQLRNGILDTTSLLSKITDAELAETDRRTHRLELLQATYRLAFTQNQ